ncbi:ABC transporter transmembrane domain-containing protein [Metabacillus herbersteinensis]|uniref:ABC transporter transmembrane domain-containing protein n=1 Tax=Metabacillus herbersteinensis TaxID=283816 RepID=A0ABV6GIB1_9BACI
MKSTSEKGKWKQLVALIKATQPPKFLFGISLFLSLLTTLAGLAIPLLTSQLIDDFSLDSLSPGVIVGIVVAFFLQAIAGGVSVYILAIIGQHIIASLRERLWRKLLVLPISYYDANETGDSVSRMTNDTGIIKNLTVPSLEILRF